jgi:dipeptidyl-peptidase-4
LQQRLALLKVDPATGQTAELLEEKDAAWVNLDQEIPRWLEGGKSFVWLSNSQPTPTLELRDADGKLLHSLAPRPPRDIELVDANGAGSVVFAAGGGPTERRLFRVRAEALRRSKGQAPVMDVLSEKETWSSAVFNKNHGAHVLTSTTLERMPRSTVQNEKGFAGELPSVAIEPDFTPNVTIQRVGDGDGFYTAIVRPRDFDSRKKYPVIVYVYGGPGVQTVTRAMSPWLLRQWLADQGFMVATIDNRGTPGRGHAWERAVYQKFGAVPLEDQVTGLRALCERFPEMDLDRVGIVGWSFGGYMSALAVMKRPDVFKAAVAGAPVTDWEDYDTHYTERYLGLPQDNSAAYRDSSLLPLADQLKRPLLLVHGTADDNVYFRHTLRLTDALFRAGREFEVLPLPSLTHMVPDPVVTERLWTRIANHFVRHLGQPTP